MGRLPASALEVRHVVVNHGGIRALDDVSLAFPAGARVGVIGPNGAGKTTLLDVVSGLTAVESGDVIVNGIDVARDAVARRARRGVARTFQDARLFPELTVWETLLLAATPRLGGGRSVRAVLRTPASRRDSRAAVDAAAGLAADLGLDAHRDQLVGELSTGTRRVLDLAAAVARGPALLLLDEPSAGLAKAETAHLGELLRALADRTRAAVLLVEHDVDLVADFAEHLVVLDRGRVIARGRPMEVLADPVVVAAYLGAAASSTQTRRRRT